MRRAGSAEQGAASARTMIVGAAALLAALAALTVGARFLSRRTAPPAPAPKASITLRSPRGEVETAPREFTWTPISGAVRYRVEISDADALWPLFVRVTPAAALVLELKETSAIAPGRIHAWSVEALDASDVPIASGGARFRVTPPAPAL